MHVWAHHDHQPTSDNQATPPTRPPPPHYNHHQARRPHSRRTFLVFKLGLAIDDMLGMRQALHNKRIKECARDLYMYTSLPLPLSCHSPHTHFRQLCIFIFAISPCRRLPHGTPYIVYALSSHAVAVCRRNAPRNWAMNNDLMRACERARRVCATCTSKRIHLISNDIFKCIRRAGVTCTVRVRLFGRKRLALPYSHQLAG